METFLGLAPQGPSVLTVFKVLLFSCLMQHLLQRGSTSSRNVKLWYCSSASSTAARVVTSPLRVIVKHNSRFSHPLHSPHGRHTQQRCCQSAI